MENITYQLKVNKQENSDDYYNKIAFITNVVLNKGQFLKPIIEDYNKYSYKGKSPRIKYEEALLELLILGTLGRVYGDRTVSLKKVQHRILTKIIKLRQKNRILKPLMTTLKGICSTLFLNDKVQHKRILIYDLKHLEKLILWLEATGEFNNEIIRLKKWYLFFQSYSQEDFFEVITYIFEFAHWFEGYSEEALGEYTTNVDSYLVKSKNRKWREDQIFCQRRRVEYHLNMVGAEIMNQVYRTEFIHAHNKILILPICMTAPSDLKCQSESFGRNFQCKSCSNECQVNYLNRLGEDIGFKVMVIPHESSISSQSNESLFGDPTGVIGVACVLNLISGGWMLKDRGIPAQCVLLDYCGCKSHWHEKGIVTSININKLKLIMGSGS